MNTIHIGIAFDKNYVTLCYVLLTSIFENDKGVNFNIHAIATGVTLEDRNAIKEFVIKNNSEIYFYDFNEDYLKSIVILKNSHLSIATYYRLFFPSIVPTDVKKLLYLDVDIVVINSLQGLYNTDLDSFALAAALDINTKTRPDLGIYEEYNYFNAGVLLMNIEEWRKQKVTDKALDFLVNNPEKIKFEDQDVLNWVLVNQWYKLDTKYNVTIFDIPEDLNKKDYRSFLSDKVIIHYTKGKHKPWMFLNKNKLRFLYYEFLKKSPKKHEKKYKDFSLKPMMIYRFCKIRIGETLVAYPNLYKIAKKVKVV